MTYADDPSPEKPEIHFVRAWSIEQREDAQLRMLDQLDACPAGHVILIQAPSGQLSAVARRRNLLITEISGSVNSCWGGNLSLSASSRNVLGAVIDGGTRDLLEHRELGFPVSFSLLLLASYMLVKSTTRHEELSALLGPGLCPVPLQPAPKHIHPSLPPVVPFNLHSAPSYHPFKPSPSTTVNPGDILVCDIDGCVAIPQGMISEVIDRAKKKKFSDEMLRYELGKGREWDKAQERVKARKRSGQL